MIKAILFDVDNTILSFDDYVKETMKKGFEAFALKPFQNEMFYVFKKINDGLWRDIEEGKLDFERLEKIRFNLVFKELGIIADGETFESYFKEALNNSAIPIKGSMEIIKYLSNKYILAVASNGPYDQQIKRLKIAGMFPYFKAFFISGKLGYSKPDPAFFECCLNGLKDIDNSILNENIMMIGDSLSSDMKAIDCGIKTCFFDPEKIYHNEIMVDHVINSLDELRNIL